MGAAQAGRRGLGSATAGLERGVVNSTSYETLRYERDDHVVTLTYDHPDQHNAVNRTMNAELHDAWQRFREDDDAFVLVITGAGDTTFCAHDRCGGVQGRQPRTGLASPRPLARAPV